MTDKETKWCAWDYLGLEINFEEYERLQLNPHCNLDADDIIADFISPAIKVRADLHQYLLKKTFYECKKNFNYLGERKFKIFFYMTLLDLIEDGRYMEHDRYKYIPGVMLTLIEDAKLKDKGT